MMFVRCLQCRARGEHIAIFSRFWPVEQFQAAMENIPKGTTSGPCPR